MESHTNIPDCMTAEDIGIAILHDEHLGLLSELILHGWLLTNDEVQKELQPYLSFRDEIAIIHGITMKGRIIPAAKITTLKSYCHGEDKASGIWVYILGQYK